MLATFTFQANYRKHHSRRENYLAEKALDQEVLLDTKSKIKIIWCTILLETPHTATELYVVMYSCRSVLPCDDEPGGSPIKLHPKGCHCTGCQLQGWLVLPGCQQGMMGSGEKGDAARDLCEDDGPLCSMEAVSAAERPHSCGLVQ